MTSPDGGSGNSGVVYGSKRRSQERKKPTAGESVSAGGGWFHLSWRGHLPGGHLLFSVRPHPNELLQFVRVHELLSAEMNLLTVHGHLGRRLDADADLATLHADDRDANGAVDDDGFGGLARQDQHDFPSVR